MSTDLDPGASASGGTAFLGPWRVVSARPFVSPSLSWAAKGVYGFVATRAPGWRLIPAALHTFSTNGRDGTLAAFRELVAAGLVETAELRRKGRYAGTRYRLVRPELEPWAGDDGPVWTNEAERRAGYQQGYSPEPDKPDTVSPDTVQPSTENPPRPSMEYSPSKEETEVRSPAPEPRAEDGASGYSSDDEWERRESDARRLARMNGNLAGFIVRLVSEVGGTLDYAESGRLCQAAGAMPKRGEVPRPDTLARRQDRAAWMVRAIRNLGPAAVDAMWQTIQATAPRPEHEPLGRLGAILRQLES